ncbi:urokinase plasminogen activator surface receptor-like isoform X1 [Pseudorasbora parva]|uniref:urokinase plasminogen activator surface receptor-like isoform X1 n=1 Tax=Pseudorasbora parva TaxID=51549 RepID=UPI00351DEA8D
MDLQISAFLLLILFTAGNCLKCNVCVADSCVETTCSSGLTNCVSATYTTVSPNNTSTVKAKMCVRPSDCITGSYNIGVSKASTSCCSTDLCNVQDAPDPSNSPNGKKCFYCDLNNDCSSTLSCSGSQDRCIKITGTIANQTLVVKGCASKSYCDAGTSVSNVNLAGSISCCEGNLCNGAQSVTQSFLFLCGSLLSYFLLH